MSGMTLLILVAILLSLAAYLRHCIVVVMLNPLWGDFSTDLEFASLLIVKDKGASASPHRERDQVALSLWLTPRRAAQFRAQHGNTGGVQ